MAQRFNSVFLKQNVEHVDQSARLTFRRNDGQTIETGRNAERDRSIDGGIGFYGDHFRQRHHYIAHFHAPEIEHIVNHGALGGGERPFAFALRGDLLQLFARGKKSALFRASRQQNPAQSCAEFEQRPKQGRNYFQDTGQPS